MPARQNLWNARPNEDRDTCIENSVQLMCNMHGITQLRLSMMVVFLDVVTALGHWRTYSIILERNYGTIIATYTCKRCSV